MLTARQKDIVKATVPLLETGGEALTTHFYQMMLGEYPEVRPLFNQAHQQSGAQPRALAHSVLMYAKHIDKLENLGDLPAQIINKHVALQIQPEHYPIVGTCLLRAIREVFGSGIPAFSSTKSLTGHSLGATGVQEAIYCLIMLNKGFIAGSANVETLEPAAEGMPLVTETRDAPIRQALSNSFGFGGTNASLVLRRWDGK